MATATATATDKKLTALPFDPLWEKARRLAGRTSTMGPELTDLDFAEMVGYNIKAVKRWKKDDAVPWTSADRATICMGVHPMAVWGYDWLDVQEDYDAVASGEMDKVLDRALNKVGKRMAADAAALQASVIEQIEDEALVEDLPKNSAFINDEGEMDFDPEIPLSMSDVYAMEASLAEKDLAESYGRDLIE